MELKISQQFATDFKSTNDVSLHKTLKDVLEIIKTAESVGEITQFRNIEGNDRAYKMGIGFYYLIGFVTSNTEMTLMRFLHRDALTEVLKNKQS